MSGGAPRLKFALADWRFVEAMNETVGTGKPHKGWPARPHRLGRAA